MPLKGATTSGPRHSSAAGVPHARTMAAETGPSRCQSQILYCYTVFTSSGTTAKHEEHRDMSEQISQRSLNVTWLPALKQSTLRIPLIDTAQIRNNILHASPNPYSRSHGFPMAKPTQLVSENPHLHIISLPKALEELILSMLGCQPTSSFGLFPHPLWCLSHDPSHPCHPSDSSRQQLLWLHLLACALVQQPTAAAHLVVAGRSLVAAAGVHLSGTGSPPAGSITSRKSQYMHSKNAIGPSTGSIKRPPSPCMLHRSHLVNSTRCM